MSITKEEKSNYIKKYGANEKDTGNIASQVAILTHRINSLTVHLQGNHKDVHSKRGLIGLVNKRKSSLRYLKRINSEKHASLVKELGIRG